MLETKAAGFSRTFYLTAVLTWSGAVALMFITAVWGGFSGMMDSVLSKREAQQMSQALPGQPMQGTGSAPLAPNPFEQPQAAQTPTGWAVSEVEKGIAALELRTEKLVQKELGLDKPSHRPSPSPRQPTPRPPAQPRSASRSTSRRPNAPPQDRPSCRACWAW